MLMNNLDKFLDSLLMKGIAEKTVKQYRSNILRFVKWLEDEGGYRGEGGIAAAEKATQIDLAKFKRSGLEKYKPSTLAQTMLHVEKWFDYLVANGEAIDNPAKNLDRVTVEVKAPKWLTENEQNALIRTVRKFGDLRELAIVTVLLHTGLRAEELCDIRIVDAIISDRKGKIIVRNGKGGKRREIPLNKDARQIITEYLEKTALDTGYLFNTERSPHMTTRAVQHIMKKFAQIAKIEVTAHRLRHSFGKNLIEAGVPESRVSILMGHTKKDGTPNLQMTARYTMPDENDLQSDVEKISWR